jgi:hypothetical protein
MQITAAFILRALILVLSTLGIVVFTLSIALSIIPVLVGFVSIAVFTGFALIALQDI